MAQAYNPYTGTSAATHQGSNAYSSWGQSVVSNGNKSAYTQHYSNANGTVATAQGSQGGAAAGASTKYGDTAAGKTSNGNMYATHDGNVYKNTGNGWTSYDNGNWNSVNSSKNAQAQSRRRATKTAGANQAAAQQRARVRSTASQATQARSSGASDVDREARTGNAADIRASALKAFSGAVVTALAVTAALAAAVVAKGIGGVPRARTASVTYPL